MFTVAQLIVIDNSPHVNAENCKLYNAVSKRVHDGFQRSLTYTFGKYLFGRRFEV